MKTELEKYLKKRGLTALFCNHYKHFLGFKVGDRKSRTYQNYYNSYYFLLGLSHIVEPNSEQGEEFNFIIDMHDTLYQMAVEERTNLKT